MNRDRNWRVGVFALLGLVALIVALVLTRGGWFGGTERALMLFESSVYGLQKGAPVVLRGVRVGQIVDIALASSDRAAVSLPVTAEFDVRALSGLVGEQGGAAGGVVQALVDRGLVARLSTQSLLSGLLYVDLDFDAGRQGAAMGPATRGVLQRATCRGYPRG